MLDHSESRKKHYQITCLSLCITTLVAQAQGEKLESGIVPLIGADGHIEYYIRNKSMVPLARLQ